MLIPNHPWHNYFVGKKYYNSGVVLADLKKWRERKIEEKMKQFFNDNFEKFLGINAEFPCSDQDLINKILEDEILTLDFKYNIQDWWGAQKDDDIVIVHYIGSCKPWMTECMNELGETAPNPNVMYVETVKLYLEYKKNRP